MTKLMPLIMSPVLATKPWGGRRLERYGKLLPEGTLIGESWEVADLPATEVTTVSDPRSRVAAGPWTGKSLQELIAIFGEELLGSATPAPEGGFPLLVKLIDAREHLSVQVHPDREYVEEHSAARLKTESWYVMAADPGAHLYLGLRSDATIDDVRSRMGTPSVVELLHLVPAVPGDYHHLPAGLVHALGAGVVVAEVQTPSDTTFRIYDWENRYERITRPMHGAEALAAIRPELKPVHSSRPEGPGARRLPGEEAYWIVEHRGAAAIDPRAEPRVLMVLAGSATVDGAVVPPVTTLVLPAAIVPETAIVLSDDGIMLEIGFV